MKIFLAGATGAIGRLLGGTPAYVTSTDGSRRDPASIVVDPSGPDAVVFESARPTMMGVAYRVATHELVASVLLRG